MLDPFDPTPPKAPPVEKVTVEDVHAEPAADDAAIDAQADEPSLADPTPDAPAATTEPVAEVDDDEVWEADEVLASATDQARTALELITPADTIGEPLGYIVEGEHVLSLLFDCLMTGYPGWRWTVSLSRVDGDAEPQVLETELTPGDDSLLAPEWVPWSDRLADAKVAEELAAVALSDDDDYDDDDEDDEDRDEDEDGEGDDDDSDHTDVSDDSDDDDESAESDDVADDGVDVLDGIDFDEALSASESSAAEPLTASEQDEAETGQAESETDDGAPQPPVQARGMQFSSEHDSAHQGD
jgi:hypothetical protein